MSKRAADRPQGVYSPVLTPFNADLSPSVPRFSDKAASRASASRERLTPKPALAASVPAMDWKTRSTGAPRSMAPTM